MNEPKLTFEKDIIKITMPDGRKGSHPVEWFPKLNNATIEQLKKYEFSPFGVHWPELDEDLSYEGFFYYAGPEKSK